MRILYLTSKPIYPKNDGGNVASEAFLSCLLHENITVKHLTIETEKHPFNLKAYPSEIIDKTSPESVFINTSVTPFKALIDLFNKGSYNVNRFYSRRLSIRLKSILSETKFDIVLLDSLYTTPYLDEIRSCFSSMIIIRAHNFESKIWNDLARNTSNPIRKLYLKKLARDISKYEVETLNAVDGVFTLSEDDSIAIRKSGINTRLRVIPVAIKAFALEPNTYEASNFFHLGTMNWEPNRQAVERLKSLFPLIKKRLPASTLHIAGSGTIAFKSRSYEDAIFYDGYVPNLEAFAQDNGILVSPLISGSGIKIKILEMMALGIPIITTDIGAMGIKYLEPECLLVANTDQEIISTCVELASDREKRMKLGMNAVNYIRTNHSIDKISKEIREFIESK